MCSEPEPTEETAVELVDRFETLSPYLSLERAGQVLVVRCREDFALLELDLESKRRLAELFDAVSGSREIGAMALVGSPTCFGPDLMDRFWRHVLELRGAASGISTPHAGVGETDFSRGETGIQQLAASIRGCPKFVVVALQGEVVTPFLGASLVCDHRVAAEGTVFLNRAYRFGMPPGGALTYLLPAYVGYATASRLLLEGLDVPVAQALELGIVDEVVPVEELEAAAVEVARRMAAKPWQAVAAVKQLLTQSLLGLTAHYELETALIHRCMLGLAAARPDDAPQR